MTDVEARPSFSFLYGMLFVFIGVLHLAMRSFGKFMKALAVIVVETFFRLSVFKPFKLGVADLSYLFYLGASPYGSYATVPEGFVFKVFRLGYWKSVTDSGSVGTYANSWFKLWL